MLKDIKTLGKESLIYGLSTVLARLLNFVLLPFYTHYLLPSQYGIVASVFSYIAFLNIIYHYGMDQAYMRYYSEKEKTFPIALLSLSFTGIIFTLILALFAPFWATVSAIGSDWSKIVYYAAAILLFDTLTIIPFADLRMSHRPLRFVFVKTVNIAINVILNVYFLKYRGLGVESVFMANILSSALSALLLIPEYLKYKFCFDKSILRKLFSFALPLLPAGLGSMTVQVLDRPIMLSLTDPASVGIYQANYRLGIFMMLIVNMFDQAWRPFFIERANRPDAPLIFAKVFNYFVIGGLFIWLFFSLFIADVVKFQIFGITLIEASYWGGLKIVPIVLFAYLINGVYINMLAPIIIAKTTKQIMNITLAGAAVSIVGNLMFIKYFGIIGAAWVLLISYAVMAAMVYYKGKKYFAIPYNFKNTFICGIIALICFIPSLFFESLSIKILSFILYPAILWLTGLISKEDKQDILSRF